MKTFTLVSNYAGSPVPFTGSEQKASSYYSKSNTQTIAITGTFVATITLQGTLEKDPADNNWFDIQDITNAGSVNVPGNFTFIRAKINAYTSGTITSVTLSY